MRSLYVIALILICKTTFGKTRDLLTTRLISTGGAGVASILFNESALLNPASIVFHENSAFYYQKDGTTLQSESKDRGSYYPDEENELYIIADTSSAIKGTFLYGHLKEFNIRTKRFASSMASNISSNSALGILLTYTDNYYIDSDKHYKSNFQTSIGYTKLVEKKLSIGIVYNDIARSNKEDQYFIGGVQYELSDNFLIVLDGGFNPNTSYEKKSLTRIGGQVSFPAGIFARFGHFYEKATNLTGNSWGLSWVAPKFAFDYAFRKSKIIDDNISIGPILPEEELIEHSFALSVRF